MNSKDIEELQGEESIIKKIKETLSLFNPQAQSYINEELLAKGKYIEAIGFILGVVDESFFPINKWNSACNPSSPEYII